MAAENKEKSTASPSQEPSKTKRLYRSASNRMISGVCGGVAEFLQLDALLVRCVWAAMVFFGGIGLPAYILAWIIVPENPNATAVSPSAGKSTNASIIWGIGLIMLGGWILFDRLDWVSFYPLYHHWNGGPRWFFNFRFDVVLPLLAIFLGAYYLVKSSKKENGAEKAKTGVDKMEKKLTRSVTDKMIAGVCGGLAAHFNIDPSLVRIGFVLLTLAGGGFAGIIIYLVMMVVVPEEGAAHAQAPGSTGTPAKKAPRKDSSASSAKE